MTFLFWSGVTMREDREWQTIIVLVRYLKIKLIKNMFMALFFYKFK